MGARADFPTGCCTAFVNDYLLFVNVWWGLVNLLPIYPLDGGRISRSVFDLSNSRDALRQSLWLSVFMAGAVAVYGLSQRNDKFYLVLFFGYLAYQSYMLLQGMFGPRRRLRGPR